MRPYRILVTGSRNWNDLNRLEQALHEHINELMRTGEADRFVIVHGDCPSGADRMAAELAARTPHVTAEAHPADWGKHGKSSGFVRNQEMVNLGADILFAFIKDDSRGATHTLNLAIEAGMPLAVYRDYSPDYQRPRELDLA